MLGADIFGGVREERGYKLSFQGVRDIGHEGSKVSRQGAAASVRSARTIAGPLFRGAGADWGYSAHSPWVLAHTGPHGQCSDGEPRLVA